MPLIESKKNLDKYDLSLGGHALTISTDQDQKKMDFIVEMANQKIESSLQKNHSFQKSLMIALLQVCEENIDLKSNVRAKLEDIEENAEKIIQKFQQSLSEG